MPPCPRGAGPRETRPRKRRRRVCPLQVWARGVRFPTFCSVIRLNRTNSRVLLVKKMFGEIERFVFQTASHQSNCKYPTSRLFQKRTGHFYAC